MKSPIVLFHLLLIELGNRCGTSTIRDAKTVTDRIEHQGLSFLTITLATFGKDFEKSLDLGYVADDHFAKFRKNGRLPRFLGGFLQQVFDPVDARLLDEPSIDSIRAVRQLTLMFSKMELPCTDNRTRKAMSDYVETERRVRQNDASLTAANHSSFARVGRMLWSSFLTAVDNQIYSSGVLPRHGPGATADRLAGNSKFNQHTWTQRLESVFPHWEYLIPNPHHLNEMDGVTLLSPGAEIPVRVISVPKTLKTPRIIGVEPTAMQYMQQGILELINEKGRKDDNFRNLVLSDSQEHNQLLAHQGSLDGSLATLDLSDASDSVSNQHVRTLVANHRALREAVDATRSRKADVDGHGVIRLAKYASMGSALCFPFESMVFMTVIFVGIERKLGRCITKKDIKSYFGRVRVYGDDIIVPTDYVQCVVEALETFGFLVNESKSFWTGKFRESCGSEFYAGHDVSIVKLRRLLPKSRDDADELISTVSFRNQLYHKGYWDTVLWLDSYIERIIPFPQVEPTSTLLGFHGPGSCQGTRHDDELQLPLVKGVVAVTKSPLNSVDGFGALMKFFLRRGPSPHQSKEHLLRSGRSSPLRIKTRWAPPY